MTLLHDGGTVTCDRCREALEIASEAKALAEAYRLEAQAWRQASDSGTATADYYRKLWEQATATAQEARQRLAKSRAEARKLRGAAGV